MNHEINGLRNVLESLRRDPWTRKAIAVECVCNPDDPELQALAAYAFSTEAQCPNLPPIDPVQ